ncbi:MAG: hypothetical protein ACE5K7_01325 [Phycisphaerae bacterium]
MNSKRSMTRSPVAVARMALRVGREALPASSSKYSRRAYTQHQLFAILVLKQFFRTDYRGIVQWLEDLSDLRRTLQLKKVPNYATLGYAHKRLLKRGLSIPSWPPFSVRPRPVA